MDRTRLHAPITLRAQTAAHAPVYSRNRLMMDSLALEKPATLKLKE